MKVALFGWLDSHGKFLTKDNLRNLSIIILDLCFNCKRKRESVKILWYKIFNMIGIAWMMPRRVMNLLAC